eukprot:scaffold883_cov86-Skeletonema_marinoi.AAC.1
MDGVAAAIDDDLLEGIILEIVIVIIDYLILLVATLPQLFLSNSKYHGFISTSGGWTFEMRILISERCDIEPPSTFDAHDLSSKEAELIEKLRTPLLQR